MFEFNTELYSQAQKRLPQTGQQIIGYQEEDTIIVYQAYRKTIADFAVANQYFGGPDYSYNRMSWIKPNFLWMMFRSGWAEKQGQETILAITIRKHFFVELLNEAVISSFDPGCFDSQDSWKKDLETKEVRLQWDPDHDPYGGKLQRRAIQLGLKGNILCKFGKKEIVKVNDITSFVTTQKKMVESKQIDKLLIPYETVLELENPDLKNRIGIRPPDKKPFD